MAGMSTASALTSPRANILGRYWPLMVMGALMLVTWIPYALSPTLPETNLAFTVQPVVIPPDKTPFTSHKTTEFNVYFTNQGPKEALDAASRGTATLLPGPATPRAEDDAWKDFTDSSEWSQTRDLSPGTAMFRTFQTRELNEIDVQDVHNGRQFLYVMAQGKFRDEKGSHTVESCQYLQPPGNPFVWVACRSHNRTR